MNDSAAPPLRALIVDTSESDAERLLENLRKAGFAPEFERVESATAMQDALNRADWDVVFSDYVIPGFGGRQALEVLQHHGRDIPFILVTGAIGEDAAVRMMKAGAHDLVMKGSLDRLEPVLRHELADAAARRSVITQKQKREALEKALRESRETHAAERAALERHYKTLILNAPDIIFLFDEAGDIIEASLQAVAAYGYEPGELLKKNVSDLRAPDALDTLEHDWLVSESPAGVRFETTHRRRDGSTFPVEVTSKAIEVAGRRFRQSFVRDITERKREELRIRALLEMSESADRLQEKPLLQKGLDVLEKLTDSRIGFLHFVNANQDEIELVTWTTDTMAHYCKAAFDSHYPVSQAGIWADSIRQKRSVVVNDYARASGRKGLPDGHARLDRFVSVPVIVGGLVRMIVGVGNAEREYDNRDVETVRLFANDMHRIVEHKRAEQHVRKQVTSLEKAMLGTVQAISGMMELRDPYTAGHERRVSELSAAIAAEMGFDVEFQQGMRVAGSMHDVGQIMVPAEILAKPARLSPLEYALIRGHAEQGYEVLKKIEFPWPVAEVAYQHHERMDGSGYPRGLKGEEIIMEARILMVADVIEAMSSHRPYRASLGEQAALAEIERGRGRLYDPQVADACLRLFRDKGYAIPA